MKVVLRVTVFDTDTGYGNTLVGRHWLSQENMRRSYEELARVFNSSVEQLI